MKRLKGIWLLGLLIPWLAWAAGAAVTLPDVAGNTHAVDAYIGHGKWTIVAVWSVDCAICRREIPELAFFHEDHKKKDAAVLGIAVDGVGERKRVQAFIDEHGIGFPNLIGERNDIARLGAGALRGTPTYLFFTPKGELVAQHVGSLAIEEVERVIAKAKGARTAPGQR